jgi:hypothetical protein
MSHEDNARGSPIETEHRGQNTNENCVPRDCKECVDGRYQTVCVQGAGFMHSTDTGVPPEPVKLEERGTCAANLLYRAVVGASGEIKPCNREQVVCC